MAMTSDPEARKRSLSTIQPPPNPAAKGHVRALSHGGFSYLRTGLVPGCHLCAFTDECEGFSEDSKECSVILKMQDDLIKSIMALPHIKDQDIVLVEELARSKTFLWLVDKWVSRKGPFKDQKMFKDRLEAQGILKQRWTAANSMTRIADSLGLSPMSRSRLKISEGIAKDSWFTQGEEDGRKV